MPVNVDDQVRKLGSARRKKIERCSGLPKPDQRSFRRLARPACC
jgi:hypothetical protein